MNGGLAHRLAMGAQLRVQFGAPRRGRRVHSLGRRFRRWVLLLFLLLFFSLLPIFLSGVGVRLSVLGLGFFPSLCFLRQ